MDMRQVLPARRGSAARMRGRELAVELCTAVTDGDEPRVGRLLSELLRVKGLTSGQRVTLQLQALQSLVHALRQVAITDETTGLCNRRGFTQSATRLLDMLARERHSAALIYFNVGQPDLVRDRDGRSVTELLLRQTGNLLRDLFPGYGVYEVLGRLSANEFAALTPNAECGECSECAAREALLLSIHRLQCGGDLLALGPRLGVAHFDPERPVAVDELLARAMNAHGREACIAPSGSAPQAGGRLADGSWAFFGSPKCACRGRSAMA